MADNSCDSDVYVNGSVDNVHLANSGITLGGTSTALGGTMTGAHVAAALNSDLGGNFTIGNQSSDTCTITGDLTVAGTTTTTQTIAVGTADTIIFEGATDDGYETTLTLVDPTANRTITLPNATGTVTVAGGTGLTLSAAGSMSVDAAQTQITSVGTIGTGVWNGTAIASSYIAADAIVASKIADNAIDSEHYTDGSIDNAHIADDAIDSEHYADGSIDNAHIADNAINSEHYADGSIDNAHIADDQIDSEHYVNGSVDNAHLANDGITIAGADTSLGGTISAATIASAIDSETMTLTNTTINGGTYATS